MAAGAGQPALLGVLGCACLALSALRANRPALYLAVSALAVQFAWPSSAVPVVLTPLYAAGFVAIVELGSWSLEPAEFRPALIVWRLARLALLAAAAVLLAALVLAVAAVPLRGPALLAIAIGTATTAWTVAVVTLRRLLGS